MAFQPRDLLGLAWSEEAISSSCFWVNWAEVLSFWQVLAEQAVGVFVDAALPWAVWVGEVNLDVCLAGEDAMLRHLSSLVVGPGRRFRERRIWALKRLRMRAKPSAVALALPSSSCTRATKRVVRSTRVPTRDLLSFPLMRSPCQWPGMRRARRPLRGGGRSGGWARAEMRTGSDVRPSVDAIWEGLPLIDN